MLTPQKYPLVRGAAAILAAALLWASLPGCGLIGGFYGVFIDPLIPPETIRAEHDLSGDRVLVWIDIFAADRPSVVLRRELTKEITKALAENNAAASVVCPEDVAQFRTAQPNYGAMTTAEIGAALDADKVLCFEIHPLQLHHEVSEGYYRVNLTGSLTLTDVAAERRVWPVEQTRRDYGYTGELQEGRGDAFENRLLRETAAAVGAHVARWFYDHPASKPYRQ